MRATISTFLFLTLALNGIVCACPAITGDTSVATNTQHVAHNTDDAAAADCHGSSVDDERQSDCSDNCDELTANKAQRQVAAMNQVQVESEPDPDTQVIDSSSAKSIWPTGSALRVLLHIYRRLCTDESPVTLKDRMLH